jgi:putative flippase GtrA
MFRYLACGGFNTLLSIFIFWFSYHFIVNQKGVPVGSIVIHPYIAAFMISFTISFPLGFILSKYIVFPESNLHGRVQVFRYAVLVAACVILNYSLLKLFVEVFGFYPTPSNVLTAVIVAVFSFISQRKFTFKVRSMETSIIPEQDTIDKVAI